MSNQYIRQVANDVAKILSLSPDDAGTLFDLFRDVDEIKRFRHILINATEEEKQRGLMSFSEESLAAHVNKVLNLTAPVEQIRGGEGK